mmetsp:Transcript_4021/g.15136  ORF Transcript_4021/g.15136 Transcript_4021/m.15136 type:complete len:241 (-) Transcript_4021:1842-2564(-)|eukprot:CAMPEP_0117455994 /NCGR_PEP_ID=MMETSP0759-20121206/11648_1 /TAXON_ID=63605 /ORGANISM="Percolomonas cosmopolitus, Strain WS" /LENGTH=240 /DNA_ID=CAMNT_0005249319 /DNA_START=180 /DNA_END=902 /DNA_ORIENTATION=+
MSFDPDAKILISLVAHHTLILATHSLSANSRSSTTASSSFPPSLLASTTPKILANITYSSNHKASYSYDNYLFHYEVVDDVVFMCVTDLSFSKMHAFKFLTHVQKEWHDRIGPEKAKACRTAYGLNRHFKKVLKEKMQYYNNDPNANKIKLAQMHIEDIKEETVKNIDKALNRGRKIDQLVDSTQQISNQAYTFKSKSRSLKMAMLWRNIKVIVLIAIIVCVLVVVVFLLACGGFKCFSS